MNLITDRLWLNKAIIEAEKAYQLNEVPVGAVLLNANKELVATAYNCPIQTHNATAHAEIEVLKKAGKVMGNYRLPNTTLYVTLEPCIMCVGAIIQARVGRVVFAARDYRAGACGTVFNLHQSKALNHRFQADFIALEAYITLLKNFFKSKRRR